MTITPLQSMDKYKWSAFVATAGDDEPLVRAALEEQVYSFGWDRDEAEGVVAGALASDEGVKKANDIYSGKYDNALGSMKISEISDAYDADLKAFLGDGSEKYQRAKWEMNRFANETYKDVIKKVKKAEVIKKNGKILGLSDDDIEQARETLSKHARMLAVISMLELNKLDSLRPKVRKRATKTQLEAILKE